jgi:hypothetical protein
MKFTIGIAILCIAASGIVLTYGWMTFYQNDHVATCHVTGKDGGGGNDKNYRIYTSDCDVLDNTYSLLHWKWKSAAIWEKVQPGNVYNFRVVGSRIPFLSQFPNILEIVEPISG